MKNDCNTPHRRSSKFHRAPDWLGKAVDNLLLDEAIEHRDVLSRLNEQSEQAHARLTETGFRTFAETARRKSDPSFRQGRRGSPASELSYWAPVFIYLVEQGVTAKQAWKLIEQHHPRRTFSSAKRVFNRSRDPVAKAAHEAASAIETGRPRTFSRAYHRLLRLLE